LLSCALIVGDDDTVSLKIVVNDQDTPVKLALNFDTPTAPGDPAAGSTATATPRCVHMQKSWCKAPACRGSVAVSFAEWHRAHALLWVCLTIQSVYSRLIALLARAKIAELGQPSYMYGVHHVDKA
jgi:hypothetical protein